MSISIRDATPADAAAIAAFNSHLAAETEGRELDAEFINAGVRALLADSSKGRYWVAEENRRVIGQIMVTYEWSDWRNGTIWWVQSVYVDSQHRRQGVFSALYGHIDSLARAQPDVCGLRLYVESNNRHAQAVYSALGMSGTSYEVMQAEFRKNRGFKE